MPFPVQPTSTRSSPSFPSENKATSVKSTSLALRALQLIVFVSLFVIFCQQVFFSLINVAFRSFAPIILTFFSSA